MSNRQPCACGCGTLVGDAHKCPTCNKNVLIFHGRPKEGSKEGYGQPIICNQCLGLSTAPSGTSNVTGAGDYGAAVDGDDSGSLAAEGGVLESLSTSFGNLEAMDVDAPGHGHREELAPPGNDIRQPNEDPDHQMRDNGDAGLHQTSRSTLPPTPPYIPTEECEPGEDYQPPQTLLDALKASPTPEHPELKARRVSAMFAHHWGQVRAANIESERHRRQVEQDRIEAEENDYPSKQFKLSSDNPSDKEYGRLYLKGRVNLGLGQLTRVEACAIYWDDPGEEALLVIRKIAAEEEEYVTAICKKSLLPIDTQAKLGSLRDKNNKRKHDIRPLIGDYRAELALGNEGEPRYRIAGDAPLFGGMICCRDMLDTLRSGSVGERVPKKQRKKQRREYAVLPLPFAFGTLESFDLMRRIGADPNGGTMVLLPSLPEDREKALQYVMCARNLLYSDPTSLKKTTEELAASDDNLSTEDPPPYFVFLNMALGGGATFASLGQLYK